MTGRRSALGLKSSGWASMRSDHSPADAVREPQVKLPFAAVITSRLPCSIEKRRVLREGTAVGRAWRIAFAQNFRQVRAIRPGKPCGFFANKVVNFVA